MITTSNNNKFTMSYRTVKKAYKKTFGKASYARNRFTMRVRISPNSEEVYVASPSNVNTVETSKLRLAALNADKPFGEEDAQKKCQDYGEGKEIGIFKRHKRRHNGVKYQLMRAGFRLEA